MQRNDLEEAKQLFIRNCGNMIRMHKEGVLQVYKAYEVPKETEAAWTAELIDELVKALSILNTNALEELESMYKIGQQPSIYVGILQFASKQVMSADSIVRLAYAESIVRMFKLMRQSPSKDVHYKSLQVASELLEDVIAKPLVLDVGRELQIYGLSDKKALNTRARQSLDEAREVFGRFK
ncbi:hypothetical protein ACFFSY_06550 [Paenibacillus aurantiacus]|uniref:Uncharacterized protein n=1 Tax=Paenibacillus aurantiacus TaxID=1936118 RepID=A0ABV5KK36_9BACL